MYFSPYLGKHASVGIFTIHQDGACNTGAAQVVELLLLFMFISVQVKHSVIFPSVFVLDCFTSGILHACAHIRYR